MGRFEIAHYWRELARLITFFDVFAEEFLRDRDSQIL